MTDSDGNVSNIGYAYDFAVSDDGQVWISDVYTKKTMLKNDSTGQYELKEEEVGQVSFGIGNRWGCYNN